MDPSAITVISNMSSLGPMFQRLPNEIILEIFKLLIMVQNVSLQGNVIDQASFRMISSFGLEDICAVSKTFNILAMQAFYSTHTFAFKQNDGIHGLSRYRTALPIAMPPMRFRHFLSRVQIDIVLEDSYIIPTPRTVGQQIMSQSSTYRPITTLNDLFTYCHGARTLRTLTNAATGFSDLGTLDLNIYTNVRFHWQTAVGLWQQAGFAVKAQQVNIVVKTIQGGMENWHGSMGQAITKMP